MVRGNGSARAETSVKAAARPNTIRITMRRGPPRDQPRRYKGPIDGTAVLGTPTLATALPRQQRGQPACHGILCRSRAPVQRDTPVPDATEQTSAAAASARRSGAEYPGDSARTSPIPHGHLV